jgi:hypothetical protein
MKALFSAVVYILLCSGPAFAGSIVQQPEAVPALAPWGMLGSAAALGISGLYFIIRRHK